MEKEEKKAKNAIVYINEEIDKKIEETVKELYEQYYSTNNKKFIVDAIMETEPKNLPEKYSKSLYKLYTTKDLQTLIGNLIARMFAYDDTTGTRSFAAFEKGCAVVNELEQERLKELEKNGEIGFCPDN